MNCPNCGGQINLNKRQCEYCNTTFTQTELEAHKNNTKTEKPQTQPKQTKNLTEQRKEQLQKEKNNRPKQSSSDSNDIATGAAVMGMLGLFSGIRGFFYNLKRTVCMILLVALEAAFAFLMVSSKVTELLHGELEGMVAVNIIIITNALIAGIICRIGRIRAGTAITAVMNFLAIAWVFIYPMITSDFANQTPQSVAVIAVVEMAVLALSVLLSHLIYRR